MHRQASPTLTAFATAPDRGRGLARDMAVRWALEEVGQPYEVRLLSFAELKAPAHRALQPFGQIPTLEHGPLALFESGAIVLHIAQAHPGLLPDDPAAAARALSWMFAAVATVEPVIVQRETAHFNERNQPWFDQRRPLLDEAVIRRLGELAAHLGDADWLDGDFSAGDLLMVQVLRRLRSSPLMQPFPSLQAYVARGEARPAFQRAYAAQHAVFVAATAAQAADSSPTAP